MMPRLGNKTKTLKNIFKNVLGGKKQNVAVKMKIYAHPLGVAKELETSPLRAGVAPENTAVHRVLELAKFRNSYTRKSHVFQ